MGHDCQGPSCCLSVSRDAPSGLAAVKHPILVSNHEALRVEIHVSNGGKTLYRPSIYLFAKSQHVFDQIFREIFIDAVVTPSDSRIDAQFGEELLRDFRDFGQHQFHFDLIRKLAGPHLRDEPLAAVAGRLPQAEQAADFVVMQQTVVAGLDLHWPWLVGTEQILSHAVEIRAARVEIVFL